ncbi:hypothetical protein SEA_OBLADI_127 [Gordonia phage ObLaDi]|uniref:Uncharacterized protein n=3 Tax=Cafassovirus TaxID=3425056 RepID=A0A9E7QCM7_9CAUD|nr:hypothetical protein SEA_CAFASSO_128 [Gordonia phage Cafasso]UVK59866.1 hypothetical protein SEA_ALEEMILY_126 [Gordonia phage Aleemily]UXE03850.1 hypothetical protein SEA_OBLADI_127 [Gordonia phage ObLaDi]
MSAPVRPTLDLPVRESCDPYHDPEVHKAAERFWWHSAVAKEVDRQHGLGAPSAYIPAIAQNLRMSSWDATRYCRQMIEWGELIKSTSCAAPGADVDPDLWVAASKGGA